MNRLNIVPSNRFKKDLKLAKRRGYDLDLLDDIVERLASREQLPPKKHYHELSGDFSRFRECYIQPDWLLVYRIEQEELILFLSTNRDSF